MYKYLLVAVLVLGFGGDSMSANPIEVSGNGIKVNTFSDHLNGLGKSVDVKFRSLIKSLNKNSGKAITWVIDNPVNWAGNNPIKATALVSGGVLTVVIVRDMWKRLDDHHKQYIKDKALLLGVVPGFTLFFLWADKLGKQEREEAQQNLEKTIFELIEKKLAEQK
ncbi:hypothetical protein KAW80_04210 [Candidatus Babeliales bacterium]|nr:hypothetical protein [Candidatus Babeliales bacterium]